MTDIVKRPGRLAALAFALLVPATASAAPIAIDLSTWTVVQYELFSQPNANWVLSNGNTTATQTVNADASILLGNFDITGQQIEGTWRAGTSSDNDFMGFVFGYQNRGQYYLFDWKQGDQNDALGFADAGMSFKIVNTGGADPTGADLWPTAGSANVDVLRHNTIAWAENVDYNFRLNFTPGLFEIEVRQGANVLENWIIADATYTSGQFGFYNYSQGPIVYNGFTQDPDPDPIRDPSVPEPASILLMAAGLAGAAVRARRRATTSRS